MTDVITQKTKRDLVRIRIPVQVYESVYGVKRYRDISGASVIITIKDRSELPEILKRIRLALEGL